jgi:hypothetical protein
MTGGTKGGAQRARNLQAYVRRGGSPVTATPICHLPFMNGARKRAAGSCEDQQICVLGYANGKTDFFGKHYIYWRGFLFRIKYLHCYLILSYFISFRPCLFVLPINLLHFEMVVYTSRKRAVCCQYIFLFCLSVRLRL